MEIYFDQIANALVLIKANISAALIILAFLWIFFIIDKLLNYWPNSLGIIPRRLRGLIGIPLHPILHGSFNHLFFNSIPLFVLLTFILTSGWLVFICASLLIILLSGSAIWLLGRPAIHIGASDLIMGYWGYLLVEAYKQPSIMSLILAIICLYYFGSLLLSIFPNEESISWEGHLFGLAAGIATAYLCPIFIMKAIIL